MKKMMSIVAVAFLMAGMTGCCCMKDKSCAEGCAKECCAKECPEGCTKSCCAKPAA